MGWRIESGQGAAIGAIVLASVFSRSSSDPFEIMNSNSDKLTSRDAAAGVPPEGTLRPHHGSTETTAQPVEGLPIQEGAPADPLGSQPTVISSRPSAAVVGSKTLAGEIGRQLVGRRLAHFELVDFVGGGGMGAVFRATDTMLNRTVAVKVLSRDQGQDEETVKRFRNEAQSAARLDHENIARVYFVGEDDGWYFIVFEFIEGQNLRDLVAERGPLSVEQSLDITLQVAAALDHAAQREVVHRDIKPSNVLLTDGHRAKLVDMGLARLQPMRTGEDDLTASGVTLGTFDYISPEQARDPRTADVRSDIYSLGCTLFYMLTGRPPFADGTVLQKLLSHSSQPPPDPRAWRPDLPDELLPLLDRMLAKDPADRYREPSELIGDLLVLADRLGVRTAVHAKPHWIPPPSGPTRTLTRHLPWAVPCCLMLALLLLDPSWLSGKADSSAPPRFEIPPAGASESEPARSSDVRVADGQLPVIPSGTWPSNRSGSDLADSRSSPRGASFRTDEDPSRDERMPSTETRSDALVGSDTRTEPMLDQEDAAQAYTTSASDSSANSRFRRVIVTSDPADATSRDRGLVVGDLVTALQLVLEDPAIDTVELRENGRVRVPSLSLELSNRQLRIVAADGYSPVLAFWTALTVTDPTSQGMIRVRGGRLRLEGLHFELTVPTDTLEGEWSLMQLEKNQLVSLRDCTITVRNSYGGRFSNLDHVSVFHVVPPVSGTLLYSTQNDSRLLTEIDMTNCIVRGEATVLRASEAIPMRLRWHNGLLVTTERMINLGGARESMERGESVLLDLEHLTAIMDKGLGEFDALPQNPNLMEISIWCNNSILVTQGWVPLISQSGGPSLSAQMAQLEYFGEHNFYEGMETFWQIVPPAPKRPEKLDFEMWRSHWTGENRPRWQQVKWQKLPDRNRPAHEHRVADYTLALQGNPALKSSADRSDAGFRSGLLPRLPEPEAELPPKTRPLFPF